MSLHNKSLELKELISQYDTQWFLGDLTNLMMHIANGHAQDQLGKLSSPLRQLYYLGGLLVTSNSEDRIKVLYTNEEWNNIVRLLNEIELEYDNLFIPRDGDEITDEWQKRRDVSMSSFWLYFNQGHLIYEEQSINWVRDLYSPQDKLIYDTFGLITEDFLQFYENIDALIENNFNAALGRRPPRPDWEKYTKIELPINKQVPFFIRTLLDKVKMSNMFATDKGMIYRFYAQELVSDRLSEDKVKTILNLLVCKRNDIEFIYYTSTKPGNPLYQFPIIDIRDGLYQVFEVKQIIHAIDSILERCCLQNVSKFTDLKGRLIEDNVERLFRKFLKKGCVVYRQYYLDGCEQDLLILWNNRAFIIEAKGYGIREPLRDPDRAFERIKDDFNKSIGYGYLQTSRVEQKFIDGSTLEITDKNGNILAQIDTTEYEYDFSIIVNLISFGQVQTDLSLLLPVGENTFPWVVTLNDLEVLLLTLLAQKKNPEFLVKYLLFREDLHGKLVCGDELEICGGFLAGVVDNDQAETKELIVTDPRLAIIFDKQYEKGMGFENEKHLKEKKSGKTIFY